MDDFHGKHISQEKILEQSSDSMVVVNQSGKIVLVNAQVEKLFGYPRDELLGQPIEMLIPHWFRSQHPGHRGGFSGEARLRAMRAGVELFALAQGRRRVRRRNRPGSVRNRDGTLLSTAIRDIASRKAVEQQMTTLNRQLQEAAREAQSANHAKSRFLSTMSHEIRMPLNAILGYAQLIRDPQLSLSKIEAGRTEFHSTPFYLARILQDLAAMSACELKLRRYTLNAGWRRTFVACCGRRRKVVPK